MILPSYDLLVCYAADVLPPPATGLISLRSPHIFPHALDPIPQLIDATIPLPQPDSHPIDLLRIQHLRLHPIDPRNLSHLVDTAPQQAQAQGLHDQYLDLRGLHIRFAGDRLESHRPVVWGAAEDRFRKRGERDLLVQESLVLVQQGGFGEVRFEDVVSGQVAPVEGVEEVTQPGVGGGCQGVEDGVEEEFAEVVDGV